MRTYHIRACYTVHDADWFVVSCPEGDRWFIDRVVLFALVDVEDEEENIRAITSTGMPNEHDGDSYFVKGSDLAPCGETWIELFNRCRRLYDVHEITEWMVEAEPDDEQSR